MLEERLKRTPLVTLNLSHRPVPTNGSSSRLVRLAERAPGLTHALLRFLKGPGVLFTCRLTVLALSLCPRFVWVWCLRVLEWCGANPLTFQLASQHQEPTGLGHEDSLRPLAQPKHLRWLLQRLLELPARGKARLLALSVSQAARVFENRLTTRGTTPERSTQSRLRWLILATTDGCNLRCTGCYAKPVWQQRHVAFPQLTYVASEAERMGAEAIIVTGWGEPFFDRRDKENLFQLAQQHPGMLFVVFTNGTLLTQADLDTVQRLGNLFLLISLDGLEETNDARRGKGTFQRVARTAEQLKRRQMLFGISVTVTSANYREVTSPEFVETMQAWALSGCCIFASHSIQRTRREMETPSVFLPSRSRTITSCSARRERGIRSP